MITTRTEDGKEEQVLPWYGVVADLGDAQRIASTTAIANAIQRDNSEKDKAWCERLATDSGRACLVHYKPTILRMANKSEFIPSAKKESFIRDATALPNTPANEIENKLSEFVENYPALRGWLAWHLEPGRRELLFNAYNPKADVLWDGLLEKKFLK